MPTARTELEMVRKRPLPFPPEPLASIGIQATRWSLDRADHSAGRRNAFAAHPRRSSASASTPSQLASTVSSSQASRNRLFANRFACAEPNRTRSICDVSKLGQAVQLERVEIVGDRLQHGEKLRCGDSLTSKNGAYKLTLQEDGNLVLYAGDEAVWSTSTNGQNVVARRGAEGRQLRAVHAPTSRCGPARPRAPRTFG